MTGPDDRDEQVPALSVVRGQPSDLELAALVAVLGAAGAAGGPPQTVPAREVSRWGDPATRLGLHAAPGDDTWRTSAWAR